MSTQQDIYAAGSESRPPMLNKENYVPWSSRLLRYAKSRPNGKLIHNSIINGPYVRRMIPEPEANDQAIQTILLGLPEDIYAAIDSCETTQEIWLRKGVDKLKAECLAKTQDPLALMANSNNPYAFPAPHQDQPSYNQNYIQQPMPNPEDITDPITAMNMALALMAKAFKLNYLTSTNNNQRISSNPRNRQISQPDPITAMNMALALMAKAFKLNYSTPTNNNQRISSNPRNRQIAQPGMNMGQDRQMQMVGGELFGISGKTQCVSNDF
nr:hypothetical protein [Tanacetum cinerariifolium]